MQTSKSAMRVEYPLTPLQAGMLFQHLQSPGSGVDVEQIVVTLPERVDVGALRAAWATVVSRHEVLRTAFVWRNVNLPIQRVAARVDLPFIVHDWRALGGAAREQGWAALLDDDRSLGFDLSEAPLLRVTLVQIADDEHRLLWTVHHAVLDGRGFPVVLGEVFDLYDAAQTGTAAERPAERPSYGEYVAWLGARDASQVAVSEAFWSRALTGVTASTAIPIARQVSDDRSAGQGRGGDIEFWVDADTLTKLRAVATDAGVTLHTMLQAAWTLLLSRYSGDDRVVFGVIRALRRDTVPNADAMLGLLINTVPLSVEVRRDASLQEWLPAVRSQWDAMRGHEHLPLSRIQALSAVPAGQPLFDSVLMYETYEFDAAMRSRGGAWSKRGVRLLEQTGFPLTLAVFAGAERMLVRLEYDKSRFDQASVARVLGHVRTILGAMADDPTQCVDDIPLLTAEERELQLRRWNDTDATWPTTATLHELFEAQVAKRPDAPAVTCDGVTITYAELDRRANALSNVLVARGVGPDMLVAVCMEKSADLVATLLGILKAGGAYVPIDPAYPDDRIQFTLEDSQARVVVTEAGLADRVSTVSPGHVESVIASDAWSMGAADGGGKPDVRVGSSNLCYVIYTSGSTGRPKGVLIEHGNVVRLLFNDRFQFSFDEKDVWSVFHSFSFDFSVWEMYGALLNGGRAVVIPKAVAQQPAEVLALLAQEGVTVLNQVPSAFYTLMAEEMANATPTLGALRYVIFGGEALQPALLREWKARYPQTALVNMFGITETTVHVTYKSIGDAEIAEGVSNIGGPIPTLTTYVLDDKLRLVPVGVTGELCVGGAGVARGYLNRPELSAERFVPHPFRAGERLYRSGDLGRLRDTGEIEYLGRRDAQVKLRGFRIELGEIESVLAQHPSVAACTVSLRTDAGSGARLVAYVVPRGTVDIPALRAWAADRLPEFMVPSAMMELASLPLTSNGKVDRKALPAPEFDRAALSRALVKPRNATEAMLAEIWASVLRVPEVGMEDNFFELGGDSILIIQVVSRARRNGVSFTPRDMFRYPTIAALATVATASVSTAASEDGQGSDVLLTPIQRWFFEGEREEIHYWNQSFLLTVPATFDPGVASTALRAVVKQHGALRLRFTRDARGWQQRVGAVDGSVAVERVDLSGVSDDAMPAAIERESVRAQGALDIERGPMLRAIHFDLGRERAGRLLIAVHHLAIDGVSWAILLSDLETAYDQSIAGSLVSLPARTTGYASWAARLAEFASSPQLAREIPHWEAFGEPLIALPRDRDDAGAGVAADEATIVVSLEEEETRDLLQMVPQVYRTRVNEVMLAALSRALARWAGEGEMVIDLEGHGREDLFTDVDVSRTLGWFTSIFPVRLPLGTGSVRESLLAVKERLRAIPQRGVGYGVLRYLARIETLCGQRTPDVVFNYLGQFDQMVAGSRLFGFAVEPVGPWHGPRSRRRHAIEINAMVRNGALVAEIAYNRNVHDAGTIALVGEEFVSALRAIVAHCALPDAGGYTPSDFPLAALSQKSLDRVTHGARDIEDMYPLTPIQRLFHDFGVQESDPGLEQWRYSVRGDVDVDALQAAWNAVIARHPMLRTSFAAEGLEQPLQVVHRNVTVQWGVLDWREADAASIEVRLDELLASDRKRGLPFDRAPLMRVTLVRVDDDEYELIWTHHHLLLDRWSWPLVLSEVGILYDAIRGQREAALAAPVPFREYMDFLVQQDGTRSEAFWRAMFDGYEAQSSLAGTPDGSDEGAEARAELSEEETAALHSYARRRGLSPNVVIQGGWALWLARQLGNERPSTDVVIGLALAGRPPEVRGIDRIIGVTINNLPVRVALQPEQPVASWLADLQARQGELQQYEHTPLDRVMEWSGVPWRRRLFDSLLVFQHHGADSETKDWLGSSLDIQARHAPTKTAFPLSVMVTGSERISLRVTFDPTVFGLADAKCAALGLRESIAVMAARPDATVGALLEAMPPRVLRIAGDPASATRSIVAPETAVETVLASQLAQVLSLDEVGVTESFFDLGGNSLVATRFVARVRDTLRVTVPVRMVFKDPTVRGLARALEEMKGAPGQLERIAMLVQRVQAMSIDEVRHAATAGAGSMQVDRT